MELTSIIDEVYRRCLTIISSESNISFSLTDYEFNIRAGERQYWIEFFGFKQWLDAPDYSLEVREVFRTVCYKYDMIFIDRSRTAEIEE